MSGFKILLDTNAVGRYLDDEGFAKEYFKPNATIAISVITRLEFLSNPDLSSKSRFFFDEFVEIIEVFPVTRENKELLLQVVAIRKNTS